MSKFDLDTAEIIEKEITIIQKNIKTTVIFPLNNRFITNADAEEFNGILGEYHTLFHSTSEMENKWLNGKLSLSRSLDGICRAEYTLWTGEKNRTEQNIIKKYQGQVIISKKQKSMYCMKK